MRLVLILIFIIGQSEICWAQKKKLDFEAYQSWPSLGYPQISRNGKYVMYPVNNVPLGRHTLNIMSTKTEWRREVEDCIPIGFTSNEKYAVVQSSERLLLFELGTDKLEDLGECMLTKNSGDFRNIEWVGYQAPLNSNELICRNLISNEVKVLKNVEKFSFTKGGKYLIYEQKKDSADDNVSLNILFLKNGTVKNIWTGGEIRDFVLDEQEQQVAFLGSNIKHSNDALFLGSYKFGDLTSRELNYNKGIDSSLLLNSVKKFSSDGQRLFIGFKRLRLVEKKQDYVDVDVWSYKDETIQPSQIREIEEGVMNDLNGIIEISSDKIIFVNNENEKFISSPYNDDWIFINRSRFQPGAKTIDEYYLQDSLSIVSTRTGEQRGIRRFGDISPNGEFLIFYSPKENCFYSYDISQAKYRNISNSLNWNSYTEKDDDVFNRPRLEVAGWIDGGESILIYDQYDIWKVDPRGNKKPVNLTMAYGRRNGITFTILNSDGSIQDLKLNQNLVVCAFDCRTKQNGFYCVKMDKENLPIKLSMESALFWNPSARIGVDQGRPPLAQSLDGKVYILQKMTSTDFPNYYVTRDFRKFKQLSDLKPEKGFKWLTSELHTWISPEGRRLQGILYKPQDFDSNRIYPVIFYYYRKMSDNLNAYLKPEPLCKGCTINIPTYVNDDYLIFTPDIKYTLGETGASALSAVVSAATYMKKFKFVNPNKLGLQGCSFGGFETNYIVTHTNVFAAAASASGLYNFVSAYNSVNGGVLKQDQFEYGPYQIGTTLWSNPGLYIENSPVFKADHLTTPLLMMQTTDDGTVPLANAIEFFTASRRLGKKVWMLQYNKGNHGLIGKEADDYSLRMHQFFNHYLKDIPPPKWLLYGRPAVEKGIDDGLDLIK